MCSRFGFRQLFSLTATRGGRSFLFLAGGLAGPFRCRSEQYFLRTGFASLEVHRLVTAHRMREAGSKEEREGGPGTLGSLGPVGAQRGETASFPAKGLSSRGAPRTSASFGAWGLCGGRKGLARAKGWGAGPAPAARCLRGSAGSAGSVLQETRVCGGGVSPGLREAGRDAAPGISFLPGPSPPLPSSPLPSPPLSLSLPSPLRPPNPL